MGWQVFENLKEGKLGEVETIVSLDRTSMQNVAMNLFLAGFLIILSWYVFKKYV